MQLDERFAFAFFMRGDIPLNEDSPVDGEHIVVASFMKETAMEAVPTFKYFPEGFRLYCGEGNVQLFNKTRQNTFIHLRKPPLSATHSRSPCTARSPPCGSLRAAASPLCGGRAAS